MSFFDLSGRTAVKACAKGAFIDQDQNLEDRIEAFYEGIPWEDVIISSSQKAGLL